LYFVGVASSRRSPHNQFFYKTCLRAQAGVSLLADLLVCSIYFNLNRAGTHTLADFSFFIVIQLPSLILVPPRLELLFLSRTELKLPHLGASTGLEL
jgi:hypothetical protein